MGRGVLWRRAVTPIAAVAVSIAVLVALLAIRLGAGAGATGTGAACSYIGHDRPRNRASCNALARQLDNNDACEGLGVVRGAGEGRELGADLD